MRDQSGTAFVLGAGLGTRLRPLTDERPKPLVPVFHKPLITFAFDHLAAAGVGRFVVNTHHCPDAYGRLLGAQYGQTVYRGCPVAFRHEPVLLDTAGGLKNAEDLLPQDEDFFVHNGDVLADLPLDRLMHHHRERGNVVTLALRSHGGPLQVQYDASADRVTDIGRRLGGRAEPAFLFTGISVLSPRVFSWIPAGEILSVIPIYLQMIQAGERVGGLVLDDGLWFDLGTLESYHDVHRLFAEGAQQLTYSVDRHWPEPVHPDARLGQNVRLAGGTAIGPGAEVGDNTELIDTIVWDGVKIASRSRLETCIVRENGRAGGSLRAAVL